MFGLYFHWSFCSSKCIYCDFGSGVLDKKDKEKFADLQKNYIKCCEKQLEYFAEKIKDKNQEITSIYFGGGTPSLLDATTIQKLLDKVRNNYNISNDCEITLEANPTTFEIKKFEDFAKAGVNRLSLGVQSMNDKNLTWLGRKHNINEALTAIDKIKNIFPKWSFDLIYGLPEQSIDEWLGELKQALTLKPQHLSLYTLIVDENTILGKMVQNGITIPKTDDKMADFYDATNEFIKNNSNLIHYEVSNYAVRGYESRHNMTYWKNFDYLGIGAGAHGRLSYADGKRYEIQNIFNPFEWQESINACKTGLEVERLLTKKEQVEEILLMGLRIKEGIDLTDIKSRFDIDLLPFLNMKKIETFEKNGLLILRNNQLKLTYEGVKILDFILREIIQ